MIAALAELALCESHVNVTPGSLCASDTTYEKQTKAATAAGKMRNREGVFIVWQIEFQAGLRILHA